MVLTTFLIIDPQVDFHGGGSLAVAGADEDAQRTADLIAAKMDDIEQIVITLDTHNKLHIAHGAFWENSEKAQPGPFTVIRREDVEKETWLPRDRTHVAYVLDYIDKLEASGRFMLCIWPEHCIIGSPGHAVTPPIHKACNDWSVKHNKDIQFVYKGQNNLTEMYSALSAEVPLENDPGTQYNSELQESLLPKTADHELIVCGQALSHCVNYTVRDLIKDQPKEVLARVKLLDDCASSVTSFEEAGHTFIADMAVAGVTITNSVAIQR